MKIAIIGAGVSGLTCAYKLYQSHDVTLFEAAGYAGGHTDTHNLTIDGQVASVDTGFIVFNELNYPNFTRMLRELSIAWQETDMSFSVDQQELDLVYGAAGWSRLLADKRNLLKPRFYRLLADLKRFYKQAPDFLTTGDDSLTIGEYLDLNGYSKVFRDGHILPMASALWSAPPEQVHQFPARYMISFMANHRMLQVNERPQWLTVKGGSNHYVQALRSRLGQRIRLNCPVLNVQRTPGRVTIHSSAGQEIFDHVIFACHSDQALNMIATPSREEYEILGAIPYQMNTVTLHKDVSQMPRLNAAWSAWNVRIKKDQGHLCQVSYWMNLLQNLECDTPLIVSLNTQSAIAPETIFLQREYSHPVYSSKSLQARKRIDEISGQNNSWFCGAYWGWGFHEDGVSSALAVVDQIQQLPHRQSMYEGLKHA